MIGATVDTNIWISALIFAGQPAEVLRLARTGAFRAISSPTLLDELEEKLRGKFGWSESMAAEARFRLEGICDVVSTTPSLRVVTADPDDDRVLECALAGGADCILSGDKHLLKLGSYQGIQMLSLREFLTALQLPS